MRFLLFISTNKYYLCIDKNLNRMSEPIYIESRSKHKGNCVIVSAGRGSLHSQLCSNDANFDLHLLVYDDSYEDFHKDSQFVCQLSGYKMDMVYQYLHKYPEFIEDYEFFLLLDDDILISVENVNTLFKTMKEYNLKIGQPSLVNSYYTYEHTLHNPMCVLRYTNFVEMMMPCFSRDALLAVLGTFEEHVRWRGIEFHWPRLINSNKQDIAIIDIVQAIHTRPVQTTTDKYYRIMQDYLKENQLKKEICIYSGIVCSNNLDYENYKRVRTDIYRIVENLINGEKLFDMLTTELVPVSFFFCLYAIISQKRIYIDMAKRAVEEIYYIHRFDCESPIPAEEVRKLACFSNYLHQYCEYVHEISDLLPNAEVQILCMKDLLLMLNIESGYTRTDIITSIINGTKMCLQLLNEKKYNYNRTNTNN